MSASSSSSSLISMPISAAATTSKSTVTATVPTAAEGDDSHSSQSPVFWLFDNDRKNDESKSKRVRHSRKLIRGDTIDPRQQSTSADSTTTSVTSAVLATTATATATVHRRIPSRKNDNHNIFVHGIQSLYLRE